MGATRLASEKCNVHILNNTNYTPVSEPLPKCPTRDASPPLELAFRACVHSLGYISKTDISTRATHPKSYIANCLHLALFACTALIISLLCSVDNLVFYLHAVCTICTYLHGVCTYLHGACPLSYTSVSVCMIGYATYTFWHRGSDFLVRATETTTSRYCITALVLTWCHAAVAAERW